MKWVTTNIRFPEDMYMELKIEAAKKRTSVSSLVRQRVSTKEQSPAKKSTQRILKELREITEMNDRENPNISFSEKLIEMRYEQ
ncbi:MAG: hypothetical protein COU69_01810 [Candidatus Pacebacteria bacterium CG10_big_fil_rev_8_21_14_0_10_56_10]|nr:MAG: hypothetical protein COU69_01810 [Candidatus Pacebacteria bacterium CG10_big_fil_rev_8_21_14_0_10_56_10]